MIIVGLTTMALGPFVEQMHFIDWWQPHVISNSFIKIEDILFGFSLGGIVSGIYSILCSHIKMKSILSLKIYSKIFIIACSLFSVFGLFYIFHIHSFLSSIVSLSVPIIILAWKDRKLLLPTFLTGVIVAIIALLGYLFGLYINPNFVKETYLLAHLSGVLVSGIPIEELIWFFFAGMGGSAFQTIIWNNQKYE